MKQENLKQEDSKQESLVDEAIAYCGNSQTELARRIGHGCTQQHISYMRKHGVSKRWAVHFGRATDGRVNKYRLRPDVFGAAPADDQSNSTSHDSTITTQGDTTNDAPGSVAA